VPHPVLERVVRNTHPPRNREFANVIHLFELRKIKSTDFDILLFNQRSVICVIALDDLMVTVAKDVDRQRFNRGVVQVHCRAKEGAT